MLTIVLVLGMLVCPWVHGAEIAVVGVHSERFDLVQATETLRKLEQAAIARGVCCLGPKELRAFDRSSVLDLGRNGSCHG